MVLASKDCTVKNLSGNNASFQKYSGAVGTHSDIHIYTFSVSFINFLIFILREKGREGERVGEKHQCVVASHMPPTRDLDHNPGMCPDWESNWQPFGSQASAQSTEPHQPELDFFIYYVKYKN